MDAKQLKEDVRQGLVDADRLVDLVVGLQRQLESAKRELESTSQELNAAKQRIEALEKQVGGGTPATGSTKVNEPFSLRAEEKRQQKKKRKGSKKGRRGRLRTADKVKLAERTEQVFPQGVPQQDCQLSHTRPVWRLEQGRAVLVAYEIYRGPRNQYGKIPGVLGRSEFGLEIVIELAYLVYVMGVSFDKVCLTLRF